MLSVPVAFEHFSKNELKLGEINSMRSVSREIRVLVNYFYQVLDLSISGLCSADLLEAFLKSEGV